MCGHERARSRYKRGSFTVTAGGRARPPVSGSRTRFVPAAQAGADVPAALESR